MLDDFANELEEIRREIVESRSLSIKTNNLVNALSADVNSIAKRQQNYERSLRWNSGVAYVVTIVILMLVGKIVVDARVETVRAQTSDQTEQVAELESEAKRLRERVDSLRQNENAAYEFYRLTVEGKHAEVLKRFEEINGMNLTKAERHFFTVARERAQNELSLQRYQEGLDHIRTRRWHEAAEALSASLKYKADSAHSPNAQLQLARAMRALGRQREAIPLLIQAFEASPDKEIMDDAGLLLAECQLDIEAYNDAKATLRAFIRRFPSSPFINDARSKLAELSMRH